MEARIQPFYGSNRIYRKIRPSEDQSTATLHRRRAREVYNSFTFQSEADSMKYTKGVEQFEAYFGPRKNVTHSRFKFFTYRQELGQSFDDYHNQMRKLSTDCELLELRESLLKDMLIIGLSDKNLQERLLRENNVSLDRTVEICRTVEITRSQANIIQNGVSSDLNVDEIRKNRRPVNNNPPRTYSPEMINKCKFCSYSHERGSCPGYGKLCNNCKKRACF